MRGHVALNMILHAARREILVNKLLITSSELSYCAAEMVLQSSKRRRREEGGEWGEEAGWEGGEGAVFQRSGWHYRVSVYVTVTVTLVNQLP